MVPVNLIYPWYVVAARQMDSFWKWLLSLWDDDIACLIDNCCCIVDSSQTGPFFTFLMGQLAALSLCVALRAERKKEKKKKQARNSLLHFGCSVTAALPRLQLSVGYWTHHRTLCQTKKANSQNYRATSSWSWWERHRYPNKHKLNLLLKRT